MSKQYEITGVGPMNTVTGLLMLFTRLPKPFSVDEAWLKAQGKYPDVGDVIEVDGAGALTLVTEANGTLTPAPSTPAIETKTYSDGSSATGVAPLPEKSPAQQDWGKLGNVAIAIVCHEANRAYCNTIGDHSQNEWAESPIWQRESAIKGVQFNIANPDAPPSASHDSWLEVKAAEGWKYGIKKNAQLKEHPCFVPYDELSIEQRRKDALFKAIVGALSAE